MPSGRWVMLLVSLTMGAGLLAGCQPPPKPAPPPLAPPPATTQDVDRVQMELQQRDQGARAGSVVRTMPESQLAAIVLASRQGGQGRGAKNAAPIRIDDSFTFTDSQQNPIANGKVVSVDHGIVVVAYTPVQGGRAPTDGDLAIHLTMNP